MIFPFFRLPLEIRNMIYSEISGPSWNKSTCRPGDLLADRFLHQSPGSHPLPHKVNGRLALLQTCQQAHEEGTSLLYGKDTFYFDDTLKGNPCQFGEIEVSKHCYFCVRTRDNPTYYDTRDRRCSDSDINGNHFIKIPVTDILFMHEWLVMIGEKNRLKILLLSQQVDKIRERQPHSRKTCKQATTFRW